MLEEKTLNYFKVVFIQQNFFHIDIVLANDDIPPAHPSAIFAKSKRSSVVIREFLCKWPRVFLHKLPYRKNAIHFLTMANFLYGNFPIHRFKGDDFLYLHLQRFASTSIEKYSRIF